MKKYVVILFLLPLTVNAQKDLLSMPDYQELAEKAYQFEVNDKLDSAMKYYSMVNINDSLYEVTLNRRSIVSFQQENYQMAYDLCMEGYALNGEYVGSFAKNVGLALSELKRYDEAYAWLDARMVDFPGNSELLYSKGVVYFDAKRYEDALKTFEAVALRNPYHADAHRRIAAIALDEGHVTQAALAQFFFLYVRYGDDKSNTVLARGDQFLSGSVEVEAKNITIDADEDFSDIDLLVNNKIALQDKYKAVPDLDIPFVRQMHLIIEQLKSAPTDKGFWSTYYLPIYQRLYNEKLWEGFMYHCLSNSGSEAHQKIVKKNQSKVDLFRSKGADIVNELRCNWPDTVGTEVKMARHVFNSNNLLSAVGEVDTESKNLVGPVRFFHGNGRLSSAGRFDDGGKQQGTWVRYHPNGVKRSVENFKDDEHDGPFVEWYNNGALEDSGHFENKKIAGDFYEFNRSGGLNRVRHFTADAVTGPSTMFWNNDSPHYTMNLKDGNMEGAVNGTYPTGAKAFKGTFKADKRDGTNVSYHLNGSEESSYTYVNGEMNGPFKTWFAHGQVETEGSMANDERTGEVRTYFMDGTLSSVERYNAAGKQDGKQEDYDVDGKLASEMEYSSGKLMKYRYFDKAGNVVKEGTRQKGAFAFEGFNTEGARVSAGKYRDSEGKEGTWTYYYADGTQRGTEDYADGVIEGVAAYNYTHGPLRLKQTYHEGQEDGAYAYYYPSGAISETGFEKEGSSHGERLSYRSDGSLEKRSFFYEGDLHGWQDQIDPDGKVVERLQYEYGSLKKVEHYDATGKRYEVNVIPPGKTMVTYHYPDGTKSGECSYSNGALDGTVTYYHPNGKVSAKGRYVNEERDGEWVYFYYDGKVSDTATFVYGERHGKNKRYFRNGKLRLSEYYQNGLREGEIVWYFDNGQVSSRTPQLHGEDHGEARFYTDKGDLELVRYYHMGKLLGYSYEGADGKLLPMIPLSGGVQRIEAKYKNGQTSRIMTWRNGALDGDLLEYYPDGKPFEKAKYERDEHIGTYEDYYSNGKLHRKGTYREGELDGEFVEYWESGALKEKRQYRCDDQHGETIVYDQAGKPVQILVYRDDELLRIEKPR